MHIYQLSLSRVEIDVIGLKSETAAKCRELLFRFAHDKLTLPGRNSKHIQSVCDHVRESALQILSLGFKLFFPSPLEQVCVCVL